MRARGALLVLGLTGCSSILGIDGFKVTDAAVSDTSDAFVIVGLAQKAYIKASNTETADGFATAIALSADGNTLAIGAFAEASAAIGIGGSQADNTKAGAGAVYVFGRAGTTWVQQAYVKASNPDIADNFGRAVALSADGNTLAVGADGEASGAQGINQVQTGNNNAGAGAAYVFARTGTTWAQTTYFKASNAEQQDHFGTAIALSGDGKTLAVGAPLEDGSATGINGGNNNNTTAAGAAYVFVLGAVTWTQQAYVKPSTTRANAHFGNALALSTDGNTLAVTAPAEDSASKGIGGNQTNGLAAGAGAAYVFARAGTVWAQQVYAKAGNTEPTDQFGTSVALSGDGNTLAVGAIGDDSNAVATPDDNSAMDSGAVTVFSRAGVAWTSAAYVKAMTPGAGDLFGGSVALATDGGTLVVGARGETSSTGAATVFTHSGTAWTQSAHLVAANAGANDQFGVVTIGGATIAVGAPLEDSNATGIDGDGANNAATDSGAAYVFQ